MQSFNFVIFVTLKITTLLTIIAECLEEEKVLGGTEANEDQFKYQVSLQMNFEHKCGGGVIGNQHILTAAHCFFDRITGIIMNEHYTVVAPAINEGSSNPLAKVYEIDKVYVPRNYRTFNLNSIDQCIFIGQGDIAVVKLKEGLNLEINKEVEKLLLSTINGSHHDETAILVGQGYNVVIDEEKIETNQKIEIGYSDGKLRYISINIVLSKFCNTRGFYCFEDYFICAKAVQRNMRSPEGSCVGDSGGPLVIKGNIMIGILIYGPRGCRENHTGSIYIKVSAHLSFIEKAIADEENYDVREYTLTKIRKCFCTQYKLLENEVA